VSRSSIITLTTDFGTRDWFVGTMKGVIARINPRSQVVDISHEIDPGNIREGAFALAASYSFFPKGTIHVAVIDPGVGSSRRAIAVVTENYVFVGPDNGVLSWALRKEKIKPIYRLENSEFFLEPVSQTFHGRDVFSSVAAHLSKGVSPRSLGPRVRDLLQLPWPAAHRTGHDIEGEIVYVDRFGNCITNIDVESLRAPTAGALEISVGRKCRCGIKSFYQAVPAGRPVAVIGSSGLLEIAVNGGSAARKFSLSPGKKVHVRLAKSRR
jgi:S-adenosyl-L-methionine hydrolase (adenosine-forming)